LDAHPGKEIYFSVYRDIRGFSEKPNCPGIRDHDGHSSQPGI
jgi:hypothetical protein